jgi:hypothetical protein
MLGGTCHKKQFYPLAAQLELPAVAPTFSNIELSPGNKKRGQDGRV